MDEIKAMQSLAAELENLDDAARSRVLSWANAKFGMAFAPPTPADIPPGSTVPRVEKVQANSSSKQTAGRASKKTKSIIAMDKTLNLSPSGKKSALQFQEEKSPTSVLQKCVVAAYYLREILEIDSVSVSAVLTFFKTVGWKVPADLRNTLQQAGTKGWLDTADGEDIKITSMGENLIEHDLSAKGG